MIRNKAAVILLNIIFILSSVSACTSASTEPFSVDSSLLETSIPQTSKEVGSPESIGAEIANATSEPEDTHFHIPELYMDVKW